MKRKVSGFTLIELLVVTGILVLAVVAVNNLFFTMLKIGKKSDIHVKLKEDGTYALNFMSNKIRNATEISHCSTNKVIFKDVNNDSFTLEKSDNNLKFKKGTASSVALLPEDEIEISNFQFECSTTVSPNVVTIKFSLKWKSSLESEDFQTQVSLRNY